MGDRDKTFPSPEVALAGFHGNGGKESEVSGVFVFKVWGFEHDGEGTFWWHIATADILKL